MSRTREQLIEATVREGYELVTDNGIGSYDSALADYRNQGYDVRCWYTSTKKDDRTYIMYIKKKESKRSAKPKLVDMPVNPKTEEEVNERYNELTVKALKEICKTRKVSGYSKMNKQQMIEALNSAC